MHFAIQGLFNSDWLIKVKKNDHIIIISTSVPLIHQNCIDFLEIKKCFVFLISGDWKNYNVIIKKYRGFFILIDRSWKYQQYTQYK